MRLKVPSGGPLDKTVIFRLSSAEAIELRERAEALGMSVSDFMRMLVAAPIEFSLGDGGAAPDAPASRAGDELFDVAAPDVRDVIAIIAAGGQPGARIAVSLSELVRTRAALARWGNNLNQSTEALNAIARLGRRTGFLDKGSKSEARYLMERAAANSAAAARALESIERRVGEVEGAEFIPVQMILATRKRG